MKVRISHVTNSSSSSFIVAKRNDCTKEDIELLLKDKIDEFLKYDAEYCDDYDEVTEEHGKKKAMKIMSDRIISALYNMGTMTLGDWEVESGESSSDGGLIDCFIYSRGNVDGEKFKIGG